MTGYAPKPPFPVLNKAHPLAQGLVGAWPMGENSADSSLYDLSGNGNDGTLPTGATVTNGPFGSTIYSEGSNGSISTGYVMPANNYFTLSLWYNMTSTVNYDHIIGSTTSDSWNNGFGAYYMSGNLKFWIDTYSAHSIQAATTGATWHHVALVYDGTNMSMTLNGVKTTAAYSDGFANTSGLFIAGTVNNSYNLDGSIDGVLVYDRALSDEEISVLYHDSFCMYRVYKVPLIVAGGGLLGHCMDGLGGRYFNAGQMTGGLNG